jgi:hypothetical protein
MLGAEDAGFGCLLKLTLSIGAHSGRNLPSLAALQNRETGL